jgi:hypothetical protein
MKTVSVDCLSEAPNYGVIRMPGRKYPALVVQGDSLRILLDLAQEIQGRVKDSSDEELRSTVDELMEQLGSRVEHYEQVLAKEHMELPYAPFTRAS